MYTLPPHASLSEYKILYIGQESLKLKNILLQHSCIPLFLFNTQTNELQEQNAYVNKLLSKRYYMVQRAKDADSIGIVVGTLGVGMSFSFKICTGIKWNDECKSLIGRAVLESIHFKVSFKDGTVLF